MACIHYVGNLEANGGTDGDGRCRWFDGFSCYRHLHLPRITDSGAQELSEQIHGRDFSFHDDYALLCLFELGGLWMDKVTA
jgi:hypothetical protein